MINEKELTEAYKKNKAIIFNEREANMKKQDFWDHMKKHNYELKPNEELWGSSFGYNGDYLKIATGKARCRVCGEKIKRGELVISFCYSYDDNPWTGFEAYVHLTDCKS